MANEALRLAQAASDDRQKSSYLDIAARWSLLAAETERRIEQDVGAREPHKDRGDPQSNGDHD
jgi:hypothetical protein